MYAFYKRLIDLRHTNETVALGDWNVLDADSKDVYAFTRTLGSETLLVFANTSRTEDVEIPAQTAGRGLQGSRLIMCSSPTNLLNR